MNSTIQEDQTPEQEKQTRLKASSDYLLKFKEFEKSYSGEQEIIFKQDSAILINTVYWKYADEVVRPALVDPEKRIQAYKIAANTELAVLFIMPINHHDPKVQKFINARLAFFLAISMLLEWGELKIEKSFNLIQNDSEINQFFDEHIKWLILLDPKYFYPVFSNAQVWRLFYYVLRDRVKQLE